MTDLGYVRPPDTPPAVREMRREAISALLLMDDPPGLPRRARKYVCGGDIARRDDLKRDLERAYYLHKAVEAGRANGSIVSVRRK